jgi:two-component system KDP operon response regulator KdpE
MAKILIAGTNASNRRDFRASLEREGHCVLEAAHPDSAAEALRQNPCNLLVLDLAANASDVYSLCRAIRSHSEVGIIVLIRNGVEHARVDALNAGADDYLVEPFVLAELLARVRAVMRRLCAAKPAGEQVVLDDRAINLSSHKVEGPGDRISHLTPKERLVLEHLIARANQPVSNLELSQAVWQRGGSGDFEYVRIVISDLRRKIEPNPARPQYLVTQRAVGYTFTLPGKTGSPAMAP